MGAECYGWKNVGAYVMHKDMKIFARIFTVSLIMAVVLAPLRSGHIPVGRLSPFSISAFAGFIAAGCWTMFCLYKYHNKLKILYILIAISAGISISDVTFFLTRMAHFRSVAISFPNLIIWNTGILAGWLFFHCRTNTARISCLLFSLAICYGLSVPGYDAFIKKLRFNVVDGKAYERILMPVSFIGPNGEEVGLSEFKGKCVIFIFWDTYSSESRDMFSNIQTIYRIIKERSGISMYLIHCYTTDETYKTGYDILNKTQCTIPGLSILRDGYGTTALGVNKYPIELIIDERSEIMYRGDINPEYNLLLN